MIVTDDFGIEKLSGRYAPKVIIVAMATPTEKKACPTAIMTVLAVTLEKSGSSRNFAALTMSPVKAL
jgi:hypothetical protein